MSQIRSGVPSHTPAGLGTGSRIFGALAVTTTHSGSSDLTLTFTFDTAGFALKRGVVDLPLTLSISTDGTAFTPAGPVPRVYRAPEAHSYPPPRERSTFFSALVGVINGGVELPLTLSISTAGTAFTPGAPVRLGVAVPGSTNQGFYAKAAAQQLQIVRDPASLFLLHATPPIYQVIRPGGTNQGYQFSVPPAKETAAALLGSRILRRAFETHFGVVDLPLTLTIAAAGFAPKRGSATLPLTLGIAAHIDPTWALVVRSDDTSLTLAVASVGSESLTPYADDSSLILTVASDGTETLAAASEDNSLTLVVRPEQIY